MSKVVLSYSGGMDSTVLLFQALKEFETVFTLTFDYGQRHKKEIDCVKYHVEKFKGKVHNQIVELPFFKQFKGSSLTDNDTSVALTKEMMGEAQSKNYVYNRNTIFLSILTGYAESIGCYKVWYGAAQADSVAGFYDGSIEYLTKINELNSLNRKHRIEIEAPLIDKSKTDIIKLGVNLNVDFTKTWTCYQGLDTSCGVCPSCSLRLKGFIDNNWKDPLDYEVKDKLSKIYEQNNCKSIIE